MAISLAMLLKVTIQFLIVFEVESCVVTCISRSLTRLLCTSCILLRMSLVMDRFNWANSGVNLGMVRVSGMLRCLVGLRFSRCAVEWPRKLTLFVVLSLTIFEAIDDRMSLNSCCRLLVV